MERCSWCLDGGIVQKYHDEEWGIPLHDDKKHFEYISMEVMQCGLNWTMMLKKRDIFRKCFADFDFHQIAKYPEQDIIRIMSEDGMIRSRSKQCVVRSDKQRFEKRGFKYLGSITVFSYLQACGIVNDHSLRCYMYEKLVPDAGFCSRTSEHWKPRIHGGRHDWRDGKSDSRQTAWKLSSGT